MNNEVLVDEYIRICRELDNSGYSLNNIPEYLKRLDASIYVEAVKKDPFVLKFVSEEVQKSNPQMCIDAVKEYPYALRYVSKEIQQSNPQMCIDAVEKEPDLLKYVSEEVQKSNPQMIREYVEEEIVEYIEEEVVEYTEEEMCIDAVKKSPNALRFVCEEVQKTNPQMCIDAVKKSPNALQYVCEEVQKTNPQMCIDAVKKSPNALRFVCEEVQKTNLQMCIDAVKKEPYLLRYVSEEVQKLNLDICEACIEKNDIAALLNISENILDDHPEYIIQAIKESRNKQELIYSNEQYEDNEYDEYDEDDEYDEYDEEDEPYYNDEYTNRGIIKYLSNKYFEKHPEIVVELLKDDLSISAILMLKVPDIYKEVSMSNSELFLEAVSNNPYNLKYVPEEVQKSNPQMCIDALKHDTDAYQYTLNSAYEANPEIFIELLKLDISKYTMEKFSDSTIRSNEKVQEYMFEDLNAIKRIKQKAHFDIKDENGHTDYNEYWMDVFYHKMIKSIGIDEVERLVEIPGLSKEQVESYQLQYDEKFNDFFEGKYSLKGEIGAVADIFRNLDLSKYVSKGKNSKFEIFKQLNLLLESDTEYSLESLVKLAIQNAGFELDKETISKIAESKSTISRRLGNEKFAKVRTLLMERLDEGLNEDQIPIEKIIESKILDSIAKNDGKYNIDEVMENIKTELVRTNEEGQAFYSPHITSQKDKILDITKAFLEDHDISGKLSKDLVTILKEKKGEIGKGWIRKLQGIPNFLTKEEYESLEKRLNIPLESTYKMRVKDEIDMDEAYRILAEKEFPGVLTYHQVELMFSSIEEPCSEEFKKYYKDHKEEILRRPEIYTNFARICNNFDEIINKPSVINRYRSGKLTLDNIMMILANEKYENIRQGNGKFAKIAAEAGLDKMYFDAAQDVYEITKKREGSTIPQVEKRAKKYRGRILRADDALNIFAGNITTCCQRLGDVGEGSMMHAATEENGAIFLIEQIDENGNVIRPVAQSWTWRNKSRMCFDNIEIPNHILSELSKEDQKEIMDIYIESGKKAIETDAKVMKKLLDEGKISQEVYDIVTLSEVTCGVGYNDLSELSERIKSGKLKESEEMVLPLEADKVYKGYQAVSPWIDSHPSRGSHSTQITLAKSDRNIEKSKLSKEEQKKIKVPVLYKNRRQVEVMKGDDIETTDIEMIKEIENTVYRDEQKILQNCENAVDIADNYNIDGRKMELILSKSKDWYMIGEERDNEYYIADLAMVGGINSQKNKKNIPIKTKIATMEMAEKMYQKMIEMGLKEKTIRYEATRDTSYLNTQRMKDKGLIEIIENKEDTFGNSDIEMNNVVIKPNVEKLKEELEKIRLILDKLKDKELLDVIIRKEKRNYGECR